MISLAAEQVFDLYGLPVTNSLINAWIGVAFFLFVALLIRRNQAMVPSGFQNIAEAIVEFMLSEIQKVTGDRKRAKQFLPIVGTIFVFILFSNWFGLLPGTGSIGVYQMVHGETELVPLLRPAASDLNLTLAIAAFSVLATHVFGLLALGTTAHISKFVNFKGIVDSIKQGPTAIVVSIIHFFVGLLEIISELAKTLSLSLRLFGNVFAGEVLITVISGIFAYFLPVPFLFMEVLVGLIQATVFALLVLAFLTVSTTAHAEEESHH